MSTLPATAREMAVAIEGSVRPASAREIGDWVEDVGAATIVQRAARVREIETASDEAIAPARGAAELGDMGTANAQVSEVIASRRARWVTPLAIGAALVVSGAALAMWVRPKTSGPAAPAASSTPAPPPATSVTHAAPPTVQLAPSPSASASAIKPAPAKRTQRAIVSAPNRCDPPFTVDGRGVQHWKDGC